MQELRTSQISLVLMICVQIHVPQDLDPEEKVVKTYMSLRRCWQDMLPVMAYQGKPGHSSANMRCQIATGQLRVNLNANGHWVCLQVVGLRIYWDAAGKAS